MKPLTKHPIREDEDGQRHAVPTSYSLHQLAIYLMAFAATEAEEGSGWVAGVLAQAEEVIRKLDEKQLKLPLESENNGIPR